MSIFVCGCTVWDGAIDFCYINTPGTFSDCAQDAAQMIAHDAWANLAWQSAKTSASPRAN